MVAKAAQVAGLGAPAPWQLVDDPNDSNSIEGSFGLYSVNPITGARSAKPAASDVSTIFTDFQSGTSLPVPGSNPAFDDNGDGAPVNLPSPWMDSGLTVIMNGNLVTPLSSPNDACGDQGNGDSYLYAWLSTVEPLNSSSYTLTVYINGGSSLTGVGIQWYDYDAKAVGTETSHSLTGPTNGWQPLSVTSSPPSGAVTATIVLHTSANACFDNTSIPLNQI